MKIVLCGPPHSGKSCLRQGLKEALKQIPNAPYPYVITACPDGEGAWFHETATEHSNLAITLKKSHKQEFTWDFTRKIAQDVARCNEKLALIDIGGRIDDKNRLICGAATHAILLSGDASHFSEWEAFCHNLNLDIIARIDSNYHATEDQIGVVVGCVLTGAIHRLERGEHLSERPMIQALAKHLLDIQTTIPSNQE